jgi:single-stranded-DNA-specific exonuclease
MNDKAQAAEGHAAYGPELDRAREEFAEFVDGVPLDSKVTVLCDGDVDGLGAGVVLGYFLTRRGIDPADIDVYQPGKGENAFTPTTRGYAALSHPRALLVLDLGISSRQILHKIPTLFVDHHKPTGTPSDAVAISGYEWRPVPTSSLLTYLLCNTYGTVKDKAWVAAIGNLGDLGPPYPELDAAAREQKLKWVREATTLLNSAKRSSLYATDSAFRALRDASSAREIVEGDSSDLETLRRCREEVKEALNEAKRLAPRFSKSEKVALFEFSSPSRIHPLLAQSWHGRLKGYMVIAANHGFLPGRVAFSMRTSTDDNLLDFLARFREVVGAQEMEYGYGHDQAAGGVISEEAWSRLKSAMGFS